MKFNKDGLIPAVAQDRTTGEVRMVAYATQKAIELTLETGRATFFSRSRNELWEKGRTGANGMSVSSVLVDCDADMALYLVTPDGPTCHTGAPTCFFRRAILVDGKIEISDRNVPAGLAIPRLEAALDERAKRAANAKVKTPEEGGPSEIGEKLQEGAGELSRAVASESKERVVAEAAGLLFDVLVALRSRGAAFSDVLGELERRAEVSGSVR